MKAKDFASFIAAYSEVLDRAGAHREASAWRTLKPVFEARPASNVGDVCKALGSVADHPPAAGHANGPCARVLIEAIPPLERCLAPWTKPRDIGLLAEALSPYAAWPVEDLATAAIARLAPAGARGHKRDAAFDKEAVAHYLRLLKETFRDEDEFPKVFRALEKDRSIKTAEAKEIARAFAGSPAKSKSDALLRIWLAHENLVGARLRARATAGRTAA